MTLKITIDEKSDIAKVIEFVKNLGYNATIKTPKTKPLLSVPEIVAYTIDGKALTKDEYTRHILEICEKTDKGNYKTQEEVFSKYFEYENR